VLGLIGLAAPRNSRLVSNLVFPAGAVASLLLAAAAFIAIGRPAEVAIVPLGLPDLPFHLRLDALAAFFLFLLGAVAAGTSLHYAGYLRGGEVNPPGLVALQYHLFLASMALVLLAADAYLFMVAWEAMALASFFLVISNHKVAEIRAAGFLYLLIAHIGALGILLCFGVLQGGHGDYSFSSMQDNRLTPFWSSTVFLLALFGFGAKAGLLPLHAWLPEAHPAAPSPVSALMSGVMLKTAIYGMLRVTFSLLHVQFWWWGVIALALGLATALFGALFAAVQTDMKRLLAYSSIENIGIIVMGFGLTLVFHSYQMSLLAALALVATLYHGLNHAFFKSLLFLATGSVLHATAQRSLGKLGGLIHNMPWVAWLALVGTLAIAGLPPLNGFVSEWLLLQALLLSPGIPNSYLSMLIPVSAAALVLAAALAGYVMVKFYGVIFLGQRREETLAAAHDADPFQRAGLVWLALGCVLLGVFPLVVIARLDYVTALLVGQAIGHVAAQSGWLFLNAASPERASYSPMLFLLSVSGVVLLTFFAVRKVYHRRLHRVPAWDCGYPRQTARMQDSAEGFGQPLRQIFAPVFRIRAELPSAFEPHPRYRGSAEDRIWYAVYLPIARKVERMSELIGRTQHGRIHLYLIYAFVTLLFLLLFAR
jgi:hydrogenase-4 component B